MKIILLPKIRALAVAFFMIGLTSCGNGEHCAPNGRFLVVTTYAGMANRLRVLASAKIMAALTDRQLVVDWPILPKEMPGPWSDFFNNPMMTIENSPLPRSGCSLTTIKNAPADDPVIKNLGIKNSGEEVKRLAKIPEDKEPIVYFGTTLDFHPLEKDLSNSDYNLRRRLFYQNLDPVTLVANAATKFQKDHDFKKYYMIGIHYRSWQTGSPDVHSGLIADPTQKYIPEFIDRMKKALAEPQANTNHKPVAFFLATDSIDARNKLLAVPELKGRVFSRTEEIERDSIAGQQSAMVDFFLLGSTEYIIGTYQSSFSDEAAYLTNKPKVNIGEAAYRP